MNIGCRSLGNSLNVKGNRKIKRDRYVKRSAKGTVFLVPANESNETSEIII